MVEHIENLICPRCNTVLKKKRKPGVYQCAVKIDSEECRAKFWLPPLTVPNKHSKHPLL